VLPTSRLVVKILQIIEPPIADSYKLCCISDINLLYRALMSFTFLSYNLAQFGINVKLTPRTITYMGSISSSFDQVKCTHGSFRHYYWVSCILWPNTQRSLGWSFWLLPHEFSARPFHHWESFEGNLAYMFGCLEGSNLLNEKRASKDDKVFE